MSTNSAYARLKKERDDLLYLRPSVFRNSLLLWLVRVMFLLASITSLVLFVLSFLDTRILTDLFEKFELWLGDIPLEFYTIELLIKTGRPFFLMLFLSFPLIRWLIQMTLRRDYHILLLEIQLDETLEELERLDAKQQTS